MKQTPRIVKSPLTNSWFVLTRWVEKRGIDTVTGEDVAYLKAIVKHDVTDQMTAILKHHAKQAKRRTR